LQKGLTSVPVPVIVTEDTENFKPQLEAPTKDETSSNEENIPDIGGLQIHCDEKTEDVPDMMDLEPEKSAYSSERFSDVRDIDADDDDNPLLVKEFIKDICDYMFGLEVRY